MGHSGTMVAANPSFAARRHTWNLLPSGRAFSSVCIVSRSRSDRKGSYAAHCRSHGQSQHDARRERRALAAAPRHSGMYSQVFRRQHAGGR